MKHSSNNYSYSLFIRALGRSKNNLTILIMLFFTATAVPITFLLVLQFGLSHSVVREDSHHRQYHLSYTLSSDERKAAANSWKCSNVVNLTVYYETGCIDSNHFFSYVLKPQYKAFGLQLVLDLVPYGNAEEFNSEKFGLTFACQHGIEELRTNTFQASARMTLRHEDFVNLVMCQMATDGAIVATYNSWEYCCKVNNIDYNELYRCYSALSHSSDECGMNALAEMEKLSRNNGHTFIPWLALNGNSNSTVQRMGTDKDGFVKLVCSELCPTARPSICSYGK